MMTYFESTVAALEAACARRQGHPFLVWGRRALSFADVREAAAGWAVRYAGLGVGPGDRVALFLGNGPAFVAAYLGAHMVGAAVVLVNSAYRRTELGHILSDSGTRVVVTEEHRAPVLDEVRGELPGLEYIVADDGQPASGGRGAEALPRPSSSDIALIGYTSGTTGRAKGAMLTHGNLMANSAAVTEAWRWTEADRLLLTLPLFHIHGLGVGLHGALVTGSTVDLRAGFSAPDVMETLTRSDTTLFFGVPTMYTRLVEEARRVLSAGGQALSDHSRVLGTGGVRLFVSGSAPLSPQTFAEFEELFGQRILERYGMTETVMNLTNPYEGERRPGTVGMPFPGQEARVVHVRTRAPLLDGEAGEIQVRGPHVFKGYWGNPAATAEAIDAEGWFSTGDLGWRSPDGYYTISGRARELIISGGYNIYPREVEEALEAHPLVAEAAVVGLPDAEFGEQVAAAVVTAAGDVRPTADELVEWCRERLASYKKPRRVAFVELLPRNALGKVQKHLLRDEMLKDVEL
ncbi:MAG: hypothetical protein RLZZ387_1657 [Chloroflexota bacterium]